MAGGLTLDAGALIAAERGTGLWRAVWRRAVERQALVTVPALVVAQVWRGNAPIVARVLGASVVEERFSLAMAKDVGALLAATRTSDVIDAAVVLGAVARGDAIVTSDPGDIDLLARALRRKVSLVTL